MDLLAFFVGLGTLALIYGLLALGLNLQFGFAGVINFGYVAFFAVGAFASAIVTLPSPGSVAYVAANARYGVGFGEPFIIGLIAAGVAGGILALLIGAVSVRLATHYLAIATFAMAQVVHSVLVNETWLTRGEFGITNVPRPAESWFGAGHLYDEFYLGLSAVVVACAFAFVYRLGERPFGRLLRAIRDDEIAARVLGKATTVAKLKALVVGGALGGIAGSLWAHSLGVVHVGEFVPIITFQIWLAMLLGGTGNHWGVLIGAALLIVIREATRFVGDIPGLDLITLHNPGFLPALRFVLIGLLLIAVVRFFPGGVLPERRRRSPGLAGNGQGIKQPDVVGASVDAPDKQDSILRVESVGKHFAGLAAVDGASFEVRRGTITGLIGPNGAGKSTMMDLISGVQRPTSGRIVFEDSDLSGMAPEKIADLGLLRTFQTPRLFARMTVWENLLLAGADARVETIVGGLIGSASHRRGESATADRAFEVLRYLEMVDKRDTRALELSGGQRKLVALGRLLMRSPRMMLLDEPAAGVNPRLASELFERIAELNRRGMTFLVIEHEMSLIMRYCHNVVVMHQGSVLAEGPPEAIRHDRQVLDAYLGGAT